MKKILYITTVSTTINAFLIPHIQMLINQGYIVDCACSIDKLLDKTLINNGVKFYNIPFRRNPIHIANLNIRKNLVLKQLIFMPRAHRAVFSLKVS